MTYTIYARSGAVAVVRAHGGELVSYRPEKDGTEYIWQGDPAYWKGQAPILFPVVCSPKDGKIAFDGKEYPMEKHGFARQMDFSLVRLSKSQVTLAISETEETLCHFPFRFALEVTYEMTDDGFSAVFAVRNKDEREMTFCIGGHPGFSCPLAEDETFEDYSLFFENAEGAEVSLTKDGYMDPALPKCPVLQGTNELPLRYADFDNDAMIVENLPVRKVQLRSRRSGRGIAFSFEGFDALGIWTPDHKNAPFLCLEPWNGLPASVTETAEAKNKKYAVTLSPGKTYTVGYRVSIL